MIQVSLRNTSHIEIKENEMKPVHKIGIPPGMRVLFIERHEVRYVGDQYNETRLDGHYRLWIHRSLSDRLLGTFLKLYDNGKIERVTVRSGEGDQVDLIKPED